DLTPGDGGIVIIRTPLLILDAGARIEASTAWDGNAGQIIANVGSLFLNDGASISSTSGSVNLVTGLPAVGLGNAGDINLTASDVLSISGRSPTLGTGSDVSTTTFGNGHGGNISLIAGKLVSIQNGGSVSADSGG